MYADSLRDRVLLQDYTVTDDNAGAGNGVWDGVLTLRCRVHQLTAEQVTRYYGRESYREMYRVYTADDIVRTNGERSLFALLRRPGHKAFRLLWNGYRTMTIVGVTQHEAPTHDGHGEMVAIDCVETPEGVGYVDA